METKKIKIILLSLVLMISLCIPSIAAEDYTVTLKPDRQVVRPGDTVNITFAFSSINVPEGLGTFYGTISYDTSVFEEITQQSFTKTEGWETPTYNPEGKTILTLTESGKTTKEAGMDASKDIDIFVLSLKVKEDTTAASTEIKVSNISCTNGSIDIISDDATLNFPITLQNTSTGGNNTTGNLVNNNFVSNNITTNNTVNNNTNNSNTNNSIRNNTVRNNTTRNTNTNTSTNSGSKIPYAGSEDFVMPAIIVLIVIAIISYIGYRKMKNI